MSTDLLESGCAVYVAVREGAYPSAAGVPRQDFIERADTYGVTVRIREAFNRQLGAPGGPYTYQRATAEHVRFYPWPNVLSIAPDERKIIWAATWDEVKA